MTNSRVRSCLGRSPTFAAVAVAASAVAEVVFDVERRVVELQGWRLLLLRGRCYCRRPPHPKRKKSEETKTEMKEGNRKRKEKVEIEKKDVKYRAIRFVRLNRCRAKFRGNIDRE